MRTVRNVLALFLILVALPTLLSAQSANYKQPFRIDQSGVIKDATGLTMGSVSKDQIIKNHEGEKIAFIDNQGNLIDAKTNKKLGRIGKDGKTYYNANGQVELMVKENSNTCDILDTNGKKIGNVHASLKGSACALACFQEKHIAAKK
ncbi:hypothetical protein GCM10023189_45460 [Nibrella saemangeumensis]|uniref:Uncharacterized protein n=1 Tax=Nibrella saemangeumensis TaxID=1084526 RepID=A0ABP8NGS4_9BACT